jgi:hypothetical protein
MTGAIVMLTSPARADMILFDDLTESPTLTQTGNETKVMFPSGPCSGREDCEIRVSRPGPPLQVITDVTSDVLVGEGLVNLAEDAQLRHFSDQFSIHLETNEIIGQVVSALIRFTSSDFPDPGETCAPPDFPEGCQIQEDGRQLIVAGIKWSGGGSDVLAIQSDVDSVPEPAFLPPALSASWALGSYKGARQEW